MEKVVKVQGGYVPKLYDGHFVKDHQQEFNQQFKGAVIIGDQHFEYGALFVEEYSFFTSLEGKKQSVGMVEELKSDENRKHPIEEEESGTTRMSKEDASWNRAIKKIRARVENTFGYLTTKFKSLCTLFQESFKQHDVLVWYAISIYNCSR